MIETFCVDAAGNIFLLPPIAESGCSVIRVAHYEGNCTGVNVNCRKAVPRHHKPLS
jgi:hypothetical protein